ncbi:haloacid dehalogenase superfamily, subfamily IA, variant 3 with third motif having DD or ED [Tessaracoccus flavus]|nr:haloacid dehalogenase superfamily, subfamily IA, variant 3 with third motif having DD or ED [Tessaracoccus flavus]
MMAERGLAFTADQMKSMHGQSAWLTAEMIATAFGEPHLVADVYDELHRRMATHLRTNDLPWLPGARELLSELHAENVPCAVVTASNNVIVDAARDRLPDNVAFIVTSDDVQRTKPHPEPYLTAMERLGVAGADTVVLEDSVPGTTSGLAAGAVVYAVPTLVKLEPQPRMVISPTGLAETSWADLIQVWKDYS